MKSKLLIALLSAAMLVAGIGIGQHYAPAKRGAVQETAGATAPQKERKLLYYRNPMGLPDTSPAPKKDSMGMDYVAVYEGDDEASPAAGKQIRISVEKVQKLGVRTETAARRDLKRAVRAVGRVEQDERRIVSVAPRFEGWIEQLHVSASGDAVEAGQPLFEVYSPELASAQNEYLIAVRGASAMKDARPEDRAGMNDLAQASLLRLKNLGVSEEELQRLRATGMAERTTLYRSPVSGVVLEKAALKGLRFMPGEVMYKIGDLSRVWVIADVFEQDIGLIRAGQTARVRVDAYPDREFAARITRIYPALNSQTRTVPVRMEISGGGSLLRPGMFARVELSAAGGGGKVLAVPGSAVIHGGRREMVLVELGEGRYEPRAVRLGARDDDYIEVLEGIAAGEKVVVAANFLIDAESNLKAAMGSFGGHAAHTGEAAAAPPANPAHSATEHRGH